VQKVSVILVWACQPDAYMLELACHVVLIFSCRAHIVYFIAL